MHALAHNSLARLPLQDLLSTRGLAQGFREADIRLNMNIALAYMESWLRWAASSAARVCTV